VPVAERRGKHPIQTKDRSGFIVNFLLTTLLISAIRMYKEGFASREDSTTACVSAPVTPWARCVWPT
jgi:3-hydroxybutyryl-CoA dehydrogenase